MHAHLSAWWPFSSQKPFVLLLDAAGHQQSPGRTIDNNFEHSITWAFAYKLKQMLQERFPLVEVLINRTEREAIEPLHTANFANKLGVDLVLSINFYQETEIKPSWYIYQFSYGSVMNNNSHTCLSFYSYDDAYLLSHKKSTLFSTALKEYLTKSEYQNRFEVKGVYKIPFKPLIGITSPAIAIEIGLKNKEDWMQYLEPLLLSLQPIIERV